MNAVDIARDRALFVIYISPDSKLIESTPFIWERILILR